MRRLIRAQIPGLLVLAAALACSVPQPIDSPANLSLFDTVTPDTSAETVSTPLVERMTSATDAAAAERGAQVSIAILDRRSGSNLDSAGSQPIESASVAKLFIAAQVFHLDAIGERPVTDGDGQLLARMLESSDDYAANALWDELGGPDLVPDVAARYRLSATTPPWDGRWWNTETTASDLVAFYDGLLDDRDRLGPERTAEFVGYLRASTSRAIDGYDQRFGIPDGLPGENSLGVKQGWMCCIQGRWIHLSSGVIGDDDRYLLAVASREDIRYEDDEDSYYPDTAITDVTEDSSARHARDTVTGVVRDLFPAGVIDNWAQG